MEIEPKSRSQILFEKNAQREFDLLEKMVIKDDLILFSYNYITDEVKTIWPNKEAIIENGLKKWKYTIQFEYDTIYTQALHVKSANRKFANKMIELYGSNDHKDLLKRHKSEKLKRCKSVTI